MGWIDAKLWEGTLGIAPHAKHRNKSQKNFSNNIKFRNLTKDFAQKRGFISVA
jgi:hypothetical protein